MIITYSVYYTIIQKIAENMNKTESAKPARKTIPSPVIRSTIPTILTSSIAISKPAKPSVSVVERTVLIIVTSVFDNGKISMATSLSYVPMTSLSSIATTTTTLQPEAVTPNSSSINQTALIISLVSIILVILFAVLSIFLYRKWSQKPKMRSTSDSPMTRFIFNSPPQTPPPSSQTISAGNNPASTIYLTETQSLSEGRNSIIENALQRNPSLRMSGYENYNDYYYPSNAYTMYPPYN
jgi:hypothetical protein